MPVGQVDGRQDDLTLADVIAAVQDAADDEGEVTAVVLQMLRSRSIRLTRMASQAPR